MNGSADPGRTDPGRGRSVVVNCALVLGSILICLVPVELLLHETALRYRIPVRDPDVLRYYYLPDSVMGFDIAPQYAGGEARFVEAVGHEVFSNSYACFDREMSISSDYVLLLGDSFTWGYTAFESKWGTELERRLRRRVLKCGVAGTGTRFQLLKARKLIEQIGSAPTEIVVGYYLNDFADDVVFPRSTVVDGRRISRVERIDPATGYVEFLTEEVLRDRIEAFRIRRGPKRWLEDNSILYNLAGQRLRRGRFWSLLGETRSVYELDLNAMFDRPWVEQAWSDHLGSVEGLANLADTLGSSLLFVLIPSVTGERADRMATALDEMRIDYVDLLDAFSGEEGARTDLYASDGHFNTRGNLFVGEIVAEYMGRK